jgi:hypothetical protein
MTGAVIGRGVVYLDGACIRVEEARGRVWGNGHSYSRSDQLNLVVLLHEGATSVRQSQSELHWHFQSMKRLKIVFHHLPVDNK